MAYTKAQGRATQKFLREKREQLRVWVNKGELDRYKGQAAARGKSLGKYVTDLLDWDGEELKKGI